MMLGFMIMAGLTHSKGGTLGRYILTCILWVLIFVTVIEQVKAGQNEFKIHNDVWVRHYYDFNSFEWKDVCKTFIIY